MQLPTEELGRRHTQHVVLFAKSDCRKGQSWTNQCIQFLTPPGLQKLSLVGLDNESTVEQASNERPMS